MTLSISPTGLVRHPALWQGADRHTAFSPRLQSPDAATHHAPRRLTFVLCLFINL